MTIANQQDVIDYLGINGDVALAQMTDPDGVSINSTLVAKFLSRADDETYSYLATTALTVPLTAPYPTLLVKIAAIIATYWMWAGDARPDRLEKDYKWATGMLADFRSGKQSLGLVADGSGPAEQVENLVEFVSSDAVFSRDAMESY